MGERIRKKKEGVRIQHHGSCILKGRRTTKRKNHDLLCEVDVEKVAVQASLDRSCNPDNPVHVGLSVVAIDPIDEVQGAISSKSKEIMRCDDLGLSSLCQHKELGQDRD